MKLIEIKNSLAKLYYQPGDFPLVLSDFLTVDDGNQKILSQVVSIETTSKENTNCAILKFSLDITEENNPASYSGYVPSLDALVAKTQPKIINSIFTNQSDSFTLGTLTNSSNVVLNINAKILDNFLYIQSDKISETEALQTKILNYCDEKSKKLLVIDFDGIKNYEKAQIIKLGKDFKLPVNNQILNYIYENDLTGLTVEQKTIVQDIILEIQEYIETLENKFIPFNTLLNVVNDIYETDKSVGVILLRNKLIKYNQFNIFASEEKEFSCLKDIVESNTVTVLKVNNAEINWQKEALNFVISNLKSNVYIFFEADDEIIDKKMLHRLYKQDNFRPIVCSRYDLELASHIKYLAKNLILFKPETQQKAFATYNSFLMKLAEDEYIISGETTFFTPLILKPSIEIKEIKEEEEQEQTSETQKENEENIITRPEVEVIDDQTEEIQKPQIELISEEEDFGDLPNLEETEDTSELKNIFEESLEEEIAKDVDKMFFVDTTPTDTPAEEKEIKNDITSDEIIEDIPYEDMFSDDDLDMLDDFNSEEMSEEHEPEQETKQLVQDIDIIEESEDEEINLHEELPTGISAQLQQEEDFSELADLEDIDELEEHHEQEDLALPEEEENEVLENLTENESLPSIPIYKTELDTNTSNNDIKIAEGNIVYHEKYGRGVVEQLMSYGNKTLCSIQFDNVGRRLLDPSLADLKQM
ncbi:MAG: hypothetical protein KHX03_00090 [Clostridium sp.]|nr:hypothetical protein [Clostridium sp.]